MGRLSEIKTEVGALLSSITTTNGFSFDFGTVNQNDPAKITSYPAGNIILLREEPTSEPAQWHGYDVCHGEIWLTCRMETLSTNPLQSIDDMYDMVVSAIKDKMHANLGNLPITGESSLSYKGFRKEPSKSGDVFSPDRCIISFDVLYNSNEL